MAELLSKLKIIDGTDLRSEHNGIRKIMIVNYVDLDEWRDKDQLFIDNA